LLLVGLAKKREEASTNMTSSTTYKNILIERADLGITILKISRPQALNALNTETLQELKQALKDEANNPKTRVLIFTGAGDKSFIAGADITEMKDKNTSQGVSFAQLGHDVTKLLELMPKPTIAAVNGFALGGGTEMAIACDFIVASEKALFGQPEVSLGIIPGFGATLRLSKFVGLPRAKELIFSGRRIKADEAEKIGLVNHVYPQEGFMDKVIELARSISVHSYSAVSKAKLLMNEFSETTGLNSKLDAEAISFGNLFGSHDQREGMGAFVEKRKPAFEGL
jgi:enoyl-CoA hydratase